MIDAVDERLGKWATGILKGVDVSHEAPADDRPGKGVGLYLVELCQPENHRGGPSLPPLEVRLRYLVTTWAKTPVEAHKMLGELVFSALEDGELEVEHEIALDTWIALGVAPRPAFEILLPLKRARPEKVVPLVRQPLGVNPAPAITLFGTLVGPGDVPLAQATVELPALSLKATTDNKGGFRLPLVPVEPREKELRVRARGRVHSVTADTRAAGGGPMLIRLEL